MIDSLQLGRRKASGDAKNSYRRCRWTVDGVVNGSHLMKQAELASVRAARAMV